MNKEEGKWIRPQDIETITTSDPKVMLDKYTAEAVKRTWKEDYRDEATGGIVTIDRSELIVPKGVKLSNANIDLIMFHIQAGDIESVKVTDQQYDSDRFISNYYLPWEVTCRFGMNKKKYLVRAQSIEKAIQIVGDFAPLYLFDSGSFSVSKVEGRPLNICDEDEIPQVDGAGQERKMKDYYQVTVRCTWWSSFEEKDKHEDAEYIVAAQELGEAKEAALKSATANLNADEISQYEYTAIKAKPYVIDSIFPKAYCELYYEKQTY